MLGGQIEVWLYAGLGMIIARWGKARGNRVRGCS